MLGSYRIVHADQIFLPLSRWKIHGTQHVLCSLVRKSTHGTIESDRTSPTFSRPQRFRSLGPNLRLLRPLVALAPSCGLDAIGNAVQQQRDVSYPDACVPENPFPDVEKWTGHAYTYTYISLTSPSALHRWYSTKKIGCRNIRSKSAPMERWPTRMWIQTETDRQG